MKVLKYIPILMTAIVLFSCNETEDPFWYDNQAPVIFTKSPFDTDYAAFETDSVKLGRTYGLGVLVQDEGKTEILTTCTNAEWQTEFDGDTFSLTPAATGEADVRVQATDVYGETVNKTIRLTCFDNIPPVAQATCDVIAILAPYERKINALSSIDPDSEYGGGIEAYEFTISGIETAINDDGYINHVFEGPGQYRIKIRVRDNDGVWSEDFYFTAVI